MILLKIESQNGTLKKNFQAIFPTDGKREREGRVKRDIVRRVKVCRRVNERNTIGRERDIVKERKEEGEREREKGRRERDMKGRGIQREKK